VKLLTRTCESMGLCGEGQLHKQLLILVAIWVSGPLIGWSQMAPTSSRDLLSYLALAACSGVPTSGVGDYLDELLNPTISTPEAVRERQHHYEKALVCLWDFHASGDLISAAELLMKYFIIFAGRRQDTTLGAPDLRDSENAQDIVRRLSDDRILVDLDTISNPSVISLRDKLGIAPPSGFVYLRFFASQKDLPNGLRAAFSRETQAVTFLGRYIAVLESRSGARSLEYRTMPTTVAHELVHSFIMSRIPFADRDKMPRWLHEVLAIHFSGSGGTEVAVEYSLGEESIQIKRDPPEYARYHHLQVYLRGRFGEQRLQSLFREAIELNDAAPLLKACGVTDYEALLKQLDSWEEQNSRWFLLIVVVGGGGAFYLLRRWWRSGPPVSRYQP
jgi:hypothetical protein